MPVGWAEQAAPTSAINSTATTEVVAPVEVVDIADPNHPNVCVFSAGPPGVPCEGGFCDDSGRCIECEDGNDCTRAVFDPHRICTLVNVPQGEPCEGEDQGMPWTCDGGGNCTQGCDDDGDCDPYSECVEVVCNQATQECEEAGFRPENTPCGDGVCDGAGACVECLEDAHCDTDFKDCTAVTCNLAQNVCETNLLLDGTPCAGGVCPMTMP